MQFHWLIAFQFYHIEFGNSSAFTEATDNVDTFIWILISICWHIKIIFLLLTILKTFFVSTIVRVVKKLSKFYICLQTLISFFKTVSFLIEVRIHLKSCQQYLRFTPRKCYCQHIKYSWLNNVFFFFLIMFFISY